MKILPLLFLHNKMAFTFSRVWFPIEVIKQYISHNSKAERKYALKSIYKLIIKLLLLIGKQLEVIHAQKIGP